jgi:glucokinase
MNHLRADSLTATAALDGRPRLVADLGGSNARFGWLAAGAHEPEHVATLAVAEHATLIATLQAYLDGVRAKLGDRYVAPASAALAVATAVGGDVVDFTNSHWSFSQRELRAAFALESLVVLNDFEALALALPRLQPSQLRAHGAAPCGRGTLAVIGPGTGLGVAGVVVTAQGCVAMPGEGGHATLAAGNDFEAELLGLVRRHHEHVSAERLLSGIGLPVLHAAVCQALGAGAPGVGVDAQQIIADGLAGDALCRRTLDVFCALLGSFSGNVALTLGARGGVYIGGGIVPRLGELFFNSDFRQRFEAKGRLRGYLQAIPTALITDTLVALTGAAAALEQPASLATVDTAH